jgi:hypothetical protein
MLKPLITLEQVEDQRDMVTLMATRGVLLRGVFNERFVEDVYSVEQATAKLREMGYVVTREWLTGQYGSQEAYVARA